MTDTPLTNWLPTQFNSILSTLTKEFEGTPIYAVGGCVRDTLLNLMPNDYDFTTPATPDEIEAFIRKAKRRPYLVGKRFGTIGCKVDGVMVEITTFRTESYEEHNRKPSVTFVSTIEEDLSRRDFTINAMAIRLDNNCIRLIDPFEGKKDLDNKLIRCVGVPKVRFKEDPLRLLRAIRFLGRFGDRFDDTTWVKLNRMAPSILEVSRERWVQELDKILSLPNPQKSLEALFQSELITYMFPELRLQREFNQKTPHHHFTLDNHTIKVVCACPADNLDLRWAALLHDIAKPYVQTWHKSGSHCNYINHEILGAEMAYRIGLQLKWSNTRLKTVVEIIKNHLKDDNILRPYDNMSKKFPEAKNVLL